jgi:sulfatase maturation enzyme AslB (radical SAM superfamily)
MTCDLLPCLDSAAGKCQATRTLKFVTVRSQCDLSCDYCYMYKMADQSWREQPRIMSAETADLTAQRIGEQARSHDLDRVTLILTVASRC